MPIHDLRVGLESADHAFAVLEERHYQLAPVARRWQLGALLGLVAWLAIPGPVGQTALVLGVYAGMTWLQHSFDAAGRFVLFHQLALRDLLANPQGIDWAFLSTLLARVPEPVHSPQSAPAGDPAPSAH